VSDVVVLVPKIGIRLIQYDLAVLFFVLKLARPDEPRLRDYL